MTSLFGQVVRRSSRSISPLDFNDYVTLLQHLGTSYAMPTLHQTLTGTKAEEIGSDFSGIAVGAHRQNPIVFSAMMVRQLLFQEARFQFRRLQSGRPGEYFGTRDLLPLEEPAPNVTTGDLLARAIQDVDLSGNWFGARIDGGIRRLRPDWTTIVMGSRTRQSNPGQAPDVEVIGYVYDPPGEEAEVFLVEEVAHWAPYPDPLANFRGMSWLTPVLREVMADQAATQHKLKYFENGATGNLIVTFDPAVDSEKVQRWIDAMESRIGGAANAYRTLYLGGGADAKVVGADLRQIDFRATQGAGENRIAIASGVPSIMIGIAAGLEAATYSNYSAARRRFADGTMRPLWRNFAGSVSRIVRVPPRAELWYDDRDIPFLAEDMRDAAETQFLHAQSIKQLIDGGFDPATVVDAVQAGDLTRLSHTGLVSIQLQRPGGQSQPSPPSPPARQLMRASDSHLPGEVTLRGIAARFADADAEVRRLLGEAVRGNREALLGRALEVLDALRAERADEALLEAYDVAYADAAAIEGRALGDPIEPLAAGLQDKLSAGIDQAQSNAPDAFRTVTADTLSDQSQNAVTANVDDAGRRWSLGAWAGFLTRSMGRRASSRGVLDASAGRTVMYSSHGSKHPACQPLEGREFPAESAPEPPMHAGCQHKLIPVR